jgi:TPR repeat protein
MWHAVRKIATLTKLMLRTAFFVFATLLVSSAVLAQTPAQVAQSDTPEAQQKFWEYVHLYMGNRYEEAFGLLVSRKNAGDKWARQALGDLFFSAPSEMINLRDAWLDGASRNGDADAQFIRGYLLMDNLFRQRDVPQDDAYYKRLGEAIAWFSKAADQGHVAAIGTLSSFSAEKLEPLGIKSKYLGK